MVFKITIESWKNNDIALIVDKVNALWINEKNIEKN